MEDVPVKHDDMTINNVYQALEGLVLDDEGRTLEFTDVMVIINALHHNRIVFRELV